MALQTQTFSTGDYAWHSWSNAYVISLTLTEESTDVATNTSLVSYLFTISNTSNNRFWSNGYNWDISIGGHTIPIRQFNFDLTANYTTQTIASGQLTVVHNADGTLDMPYSVSIPNVQNWVSYGPPAMAMSGVWVLTPIPRQATITAAPNFSDEENPTIAYTNPAGNGADYLLACISLTGERPDVEYRDIPKDGSSYTFTLTEAERNVLRSATATTNARSVFFFVRTVIAGVDHYSILERTFSVVDGAPILSPMVQDSNSATLALTGNSGVLVRYYSNAAVTTGAAALKGATLVSQKVICGSQEFASAEGTISQVESGTFTFAVTDSRGNTTHQQVDKTLIPYVKLTCNLSNNKPDGNGDMSVKVTGNCFSGSFGAVSNTLTVQYRYKVSGGNFGDWQTMTVVKSGNAYTATASLSGLDYQTAYTFQARATDALATVHSAEYTARAMPVFDWGENDFNVNGILKINGIIKINGITMNDYVIERGTSGIWTYKLYANGYAECWGTISCVQTNPAVCHTRLTLPFRIASGVAVGTLAYSDEENTSNMRVVKIKVEGMTCDCLVFTNTADFLEGMTRDVMVHVIAKRA